MEWSHQHYKHKLSQAFFLPLNPGGYLNKKRKLFLFQSQLNLAVYLHSFFPEYNQQNFPNFGLTFHQPPYQNRPLTPNKSPQK